MEADSQVNHIYIHQHIAHWPQPSYTDKHLVIQVETFKVLFAVFTQGLFLNISDTLGIANVSKASQVDLMLV